jgi:hypothetical protein
MLLVEHLYMSTHGERMGSAVNMGTTAVQKLRMSRHNINSPHTADTLQETELASVLILEFGVRSSYCGRQSIDQFVLVSSLTLGSLTRFFLVLLFSFDCYFILFPMASSLTRKRVCSLECVHSLVRSLTTNNHALPSHLRLCSLSVASYDSQGLRWKYSNHSPHGESSSDTASPTVGHIGLRGGRPWFDPGTSNVFVFSIVSRPALGPT